MKTIVYVDGLNLYYGCLQKSPYKWLDLSALFTKILGPKYQITEIRYFTALVKPTTPDNGDPQKQGNYIRALRSYRPEGSPKIKVEYGKFQDSITRMPMAKPPHSMVEVIKTEEKCTDVNLATRMLDDAWRNKLECAVLVSSDSDMAGAMQLIRQIPSPVRLGLVMPEKTYSFRTEKRYTPGKLKNKVCFERIIRESALRSCQLPDPIPDTNIKKPKEW